MADANDHYSQIFPWNVVPQVRSPKPVQPLPELKCHPDDSIQALVFSNASIVVIKGYEYKSYLNLNDCFVPIDGFFQMEILIPVLQDSYHYDFEAYHTEDAEFVTINYGPLQSIVGDVQFVALFPQYLNTTIDDQTLWRLHFRFQGETDWRELGRVFIWSASSVSGIPPIEIKNDILGTDVFIKLMVCN